MLMTSFDAAEHPASGERRMDVDLAKDEDGPAQAALLPDSEWSWKGVHARQVDYLAWQVLLSAVAVLER